VPNQTVRQQARRAALDAQTRLRQERNEQERRRSALAVAVVTALAERDALVLACEARAGTALRALTENEHLSLRDAVEWCGGVTQLSLRDATRLRQIRAMQGTPGRDGAAEPAPVRSGLPGRDFNPVRGSGVTEPPSASPSGADFPVGDHPAMRGRLTEHERQFPHEH
jgi:hypothetical protein